MQIAKSVVLPSGENIGYWDIIFVGIDPKAQNARIQLAGYIDQSHFDDGHGPATSRVVEMGFSGLTAIASLQSQVALVLPDLIV